MVDIAPPMLVQALAADLAIEALDIAILTGCSYLDKRVFDLLGVGSLLQGGTCELRTTISDSALSFFRSSIS